MEMDTLRECRLLLVLLPLIDARFAQCCCRPDWERLLRCACWYCCCWSCSCRVGVVAAGLLWLFPEMDDFRDLCTLCRVFLDGVEGAEVGDATDADPEPELVLPCLARYDLSWARGPRISTTISSNIPPSSQCEAAYLLARAQQLVLSRRAGVLHHQRERGG